MDLRQRRHKGRVNVPNFDQLVWVAGLQRDSASRTDQRRDDEPSHQPGDEHQHPDEQQHTPDRARVGIAAIDTCKSANGDQSPKRDGPEDEPWRDPRSKPHQSAAGPRERQMPARFTETAAITTAPMSKPMTPRTISTSSA